MEAEYLPIVYVCYSFCGDIRQTWEAVNLFAEQIGEGYDGIILVGFGELGDEIYSHFFPRPMGNVQGSSYGLRVLDMFFLSTYIATFYVSPDKRSHGRPPELPFYQF